jgi:hypothetical protein
MKRLLILFFLPATIFFACAPDTPEGWSELNLLRYGVPISLMAPDSAEVKTMDLGLMKDISVKKGDDYFLQITVSEATDLDVGRLLVEQKSAEEGRRNFSRIVQEEPNGFIVERAIDSTRMTYDFRKILIKGEQEIILQTGLSGFYSLEEVERMYESINE